jgi:hypothetical protein
LSYSISVHLNLQVTEDDVDDILVAALEGGINYWCRKVHPLNDDYCGALFASNVLTKGGTLVFVTEDQIFFLNLAGFLSGFTRWIALKSNPPLDGVGIETGMIDADDADAIIQYALFGDIVYS